MGQEVAPPGWYPDPYQHGSVRYFDGSQWTVHAVPSDKADPSAMVQADFAKDQHRAEGWQPGDPDFPWWDVAVPQGTERPFDFAGGAGGYGAVARGREAVRLSSRFRRRGAIFTVIGVVLLGYLALYDPRHRALFLIAGAVFLGGAIVFGVRRMRMESHWKRVGEMGADGMGQPKDWGSQ